MCAGCRKSLVHSRCLTAIIVQNKMSTTNKGYAKDQPTDFFNRIE